MDISEAQRDVRRVYRGGFAGQLVSGMVWLAAAAVGAWFGPVAAIPALFLGGVLIFPLTTTVLKAAGGPAGLPKGHPMVGLASQIAMTVPAGFLVAIVLGINAPELYFPAAMVIVGAHYLPFVFLYGMRMFGVLAAVLVFAAVAFVSWLPGLVGFSGWFTGAVLIIFAILLPQQALRLDRAVLRGTADA